MIDHAPKAQEKVTEEAFAEFVEGHPELNEVTEQLGSRALEALPFGVDMTVDVTPAEAYVNDTTTNMGGKTDSCKDN